MVSPIIDWPGIGANLTWMKRSKSMRAEQLGGLKRIVGEKSRLQCAGLNRHEVEDERALRERSTDPLGLESCAATARATAKRRQRIGGVGIQLRKDATRTPTSLVMRGRQHEQGR